MVMVMLQLTGLDEREKRIKKRKGKKRLSTASMDRRGAAWWMRKAYCLHEN